MSDIVQQRAPMRVERRIITDREEWLSWRKHDITASRIGALFDCHPYETALRLYAEQRGVEFIVEENSAMRRGRWCEPAGIEAVTEKRPEWALERAKVYLRDPVLKLGATPDAFITNDPRGLGVLQIKTVAPSVFYREWDEGREVPLWITLQCLTEMMLAEAVFGAVAMLLIDPHAMDCYIHEVPRNQQAENKIVRSVEDFWRMVEAGQEPEPDYGRDVDVIKAMTAHEAPGKQVDWSGDNEIPALLGRRAHLMERIKQDEASKETIETEIKHKLGDAERVSGVNGWSLSYKTTDFKEYTVKARSTRVLRITDKRKPEAA